MQVCPSCKLENLDTAKFCQNCGIQFAEQAKPEKPPVGDSTLRDGAASEVDNQVVQVPTIICPHCGKESLPDIDTCLNCGKLLSEPVAPPSIQEPKAPAQVKKEVVFLPPEGKPALQEEVPIDDSKEGWEVIICPSCGKKTRIRFGYCLFCKADLTGESESVPIIPDTPSEPKEEKVVTLPSPLYKPQKSRLRLVIPLFLLFFILLVAVLSGILLIKMRSKVSELAKSPTLATEPQKALLETGSGTVSAVFETVRDAMLSKDTELLMSCYSSQFPDYQAKLQDTDELIKTYDIVSLSFSIDSSAMKIAGATAEIPIKWTIKLRKYDDGTTLSAVDSNYVVLTKENNQWKIKQVSQR